MGQFEGNYLSDQMNRWSRCLRSADQHRSSLRRQRESSVARASDVWSL